MTEKIVDWDIKHQHKQKQTKTNKKKYSANSMDPDQTAPEGAVWSGLIMFATWYADGAGQKILEG